jgi:hypothetical protein
LSKLGQRRDDPLVGDLRVLFLTDLICSREQTVLPLLVRDRETVFPPAAGRHIDVKIAASISPTFAVPFAPSSFALASMICAASAAGNHWFAVDRQLEGIRSAAKRLNDRLVDVFPLFVSRRPLTLTAYLALLSRPAGSRPPPSPPR